MKKLIMKDDDGREVQIGVAVEREDGWHLTFCAYPVNGKVIMQDMVAEAKDHVYMGLAGGRVCRVCRQAESETSSTCPGEKPGTLVEAAKAAEAHPAAGFKNKLIHDMQASDELHVAVKRKVEKPSTD